MIESITSIAVTSFTGYWRYFISLLTKPDVNNFFYALLVLSMLVWLLEIAFPWRKKQNIVRKDFWLDGFYMFFNVFLFSLAGWSVFSAFGSILFQKGLAALGVRDLVLINIESWPRWSQLIIMFVWVDFIHWNVHRLLHRKAFFWKFHKIHHSVLQMGFAAHLRFHFLETVMYKSLQYVPLALIGFGINDFFIVYVFSLAIGHLNHSNLRITYGPFKKVLNNPVMHLWHHAKKLPEGSYGVNFGLSLSIWDYLFKTDYIPNDNEYEPLGFKGVEKFPVSFIGQFVYPFIKTKGAAL
jgi:sterol desaturase/sphingolipid hydroxylase (fatty acid hydroxylase superfamily)